MESQTNILIKKGTTEVSIKNVSEDFLQSSHFLKLLELFDLKNDLPEIKSNDKKVVPMVNKKMNDRNLVKDRLPNTIDLSEVDIKKAVTNEPKIRCPKCGQTDKAIVRIKPDESYFMRKDKSGDKEEYIPIAILDSDEAINNICKPEKSDMKDYNDDIYKIRIPKSLKNANINVAQDTAITCPICKYTSLFQAWNEAYNNPLEYGFETELLCDMCGNEAVDKVTKDNKHVIHCESCGYEKDVL